jgi:ABC-type transport system involved in cytochrome bd biosynthesis fused ATPase/permease subunit
MNADLIVVLDRGRIVQQGRHDELMADPGGAYRRIYDLQAQIEEEVSREVGGPDGDGRQVTEQARP